MFVRWVWSGVAVASAVALSAGTASATVAAHIVDGIHLHSDGVDIVRTATDETHESFTSLSSFPTPAGFVDATVWLTESTSEGGGISDGFTLVNNPTTGHVDAYFISDGASAAEVAAFVVSTNVFTIPETGAWQDVSQYFGQSAGFAQVISDVPEPQTWALMILGLLAIGAVARRTRRAGALA